MTANEKYVAHIKTHLLASDKKSRKKDFWQSYDLKGEEQEEVLHLSFERFNSLRVIRQ